MMDLDNKVSLVTGAGQGIGEGIAKNLASKGSDAIVVITKWIVYSKFDWKEISNNMRKPDWVFDARYVLSKRKVLEADLDGAQESNLSQLRIWRMPFD